MRAPSCRSRHRAACSMPPSSDAVGAQSDRAALAALCNARGPAPAPGAKYHHVSFGGAELRWESHAEFCTYTWDLPSLDLAEGGLPFQPPATTPASPFGEVPQPGPLLVAVDLHLPWDTAEDFFLERCSTAPASPART